MRVTFPIIDYFDHFFEATELDDYWATLYLPKTNTPRPIVALWLIAVSEQFEDSLFEKPKIIDTIKEDLNKYPNSVSGYDKLIAYYTDLNSHFSFLSQVANEKKIDTKRDKRIARNQRRVAEREVEKKNRRMSIFLSNLTWSTFDSQRNIYILTDTAPFSVFPSYFEYLKNQIENHSVHIQFTN